MAGDRTFLFGVDTVVRGMSPPYENVLFVPFRNVRLTGVTLGVGRARSSDHDPAGPRPSGGAEEGTGKADYAEAGSSGVADHRASGAADAEAAEKGRRQSCDTRSAGSSVK